MTVVADLLICLRFFSRLPVPATARERALGTGGLAAAAAMAPLAGAVLALVPVAILAAAGLAGLPPAVVAPLAIAGLAAVTGALHEDALADCADGFGGGRTRERKLEIMRDSRIGAFGALAIAVSFYVRVVAVAAILGGTGAAQGLGAAIASLVAAAALSRAACLVPLALLPPARPDGVGAAATGLEWRVATAAGLALVLALTAGAEAGSATRGLAAFAAAGVAALAMSALAWRQIGGQTGDVAGGTQQVAEIAVLLVFCAA